MATILDFNAALARRNAEAAKPTDAQVKSALTTILAAMSLPSVDEEAVKRENARLAAVQATHFTGAKYDRSLDVKDIAKLVRADIAAAVKDGTLPAGFKASVKIDRYSMGSSINVTITACRGMIVNPRRVEADIAEPYGVAKLPLRTARAEQILDAIKSIVDAYNYDKSDRGTDYYNVRFYSGVEFSSELINAQTAEIKAAIVARTA